MLRKKGRGEHDPGTETAGPAPGARLDSGGAGGEAGRLPAGAEQVGVRLALPDTKNVVQLARIFGVSTDYLLLEGAGRGPASEARRRRRRGDLPGAVTLILGAAGALLFEILTPVFDYRRTVVYAGTGRSETFEGMLAFMRYDRLGWLFALCLVLAIGGAVTLLAPRVKSALAWMLREGD